MPPSQIKAVNKKHHARMEKETILYRYLMIGAGLVVLAVIGLMVIGFVQTNILPPKQPVAKVGGEDIITEDFQARVRFERDRMVQQYSQAYQTMQSFNDNPDMQKYFQQNLDQLKGELEPQKMGEQILDRMIKNVLIRQEAVKRGITVSEKEVDVEIQKQFGFQAAGVSATATNTPFPTIMPTSTLSAAQLTLVPQWTATVTATPAVTETPTIVPSPTLIPSATAVPSITPSATPYTLDKYNADYKSVIDRYTKEIKFNEKQLRDLIRSDLYSKKLFEVMSVSVPIEQDQVWARHILVADEDTAKKALAEIKTGSPWNDVTKKYSTDTGSKDSGGDLGWFSKGAMIKEFEDVAYKLGIGEISDPVKTQFGWHIIQVLGHEKRSLNSSEYQGTQDKAFQDWLDQQRKGSSVQVFDVWKERVPTTPELPAGI
ncbi:MAG: peptidylprolyl isomerase [Chloroflexota bacterium]